MLISSNIRILLSILFLILISISSTYSQSSSDLDSLEGKFALQFQISEDFTLTNFQGTTFSGKYHFSSRDAVRLGLSLDFGDSDVDATTNQYDSVNVVNINSEQNSFGITFNTQYIRYISGTNDVAFFGGVGPFITFNTSTTEGKTSGFPEDINYKESNDVFAVGLDLILGVEWFFCRNMSLSVEYGLKLSYRSTTRKYENDYILRETEDKTYRAMGNNVNFGISIYF